MGIFDWLFKKGNENIEKYIKRKKRSTRLRGYINEIERERYNLCKNLGYNENKCLEFSNYILRRFKCPKCYFAGYSENQSNGFISRREWGNSPAPLVGSGGSETFCTKHKITISQTIWVS